MTEPARTRPRVEPPPSTYYYRRKLTFREQLPALAAGVVAGLATFYVVRLLLQRTPLDVAAPRRDRPNERRGRA